MNLYKEIIKAISPKTYAKEKGVTYGHARKKAVQDIYKETMNKRTYNKLKQVMEKYESLQFKK